MVDLLLTKIDTFSLHKTLFELVWSFGLLVDCCDIFICYLDSHSDGTHSMLVIHWGASDIMQNFSKSVPMKQALLHLGWPEVVQMRFLGELLI